MQEVCTGSMSTTCKVSESVTEQVMIHAQHSRDVRSSIAHATPMLSVLIDQQRQFLRYVIMPDTAENNYFSNDQVLPYPSSTSIITCPLILVLYRCILSLPPPPAYVLSVNSNPSYIRTSIWNLSQKIAFATSLQQENAIKTTVYSSLAIMHVVHVRVQSLICWEN